MENEVIPDGYKEVAAQGGKTMKLATEEGGLVDVSVMPDPLTWRSEEFDATEKASQFMKALELPESQAPFLGHTLHHVYKDEVGGQIINGCFVDANGSLYLHKEGLPLTA